MTYKAGILMPLHDLTRRTYDRSLKNSRSKKENVAGNSKRSPLNRTLTNETNKRSIRSGYSIESSSPQIVVRKKSGGYVLAGFSLYDRTFSKKEVEFMKMVTMALDQKLKPKGV